jgi:TM2 domain-containing membrane protein YozV
MENNIQSKKMVAGICAILLGSLGVHKFILGYNKEGIILLVIFLVIIPILTVVSCGMGFMLYGLGVLPVIEGIIYLTKSDEAFIETYQNNKKAWF